MLEGVLQPSARSKPAAHWGLLPLGEQWLPGQAGAAVQPLRQLTVAGLTKPFLLEPETC